MTDLVLELSSVAKEISKYWDRLANPDAIDGYSVLIPEDVLPELQCAIEESLKPASRAEIAKAVAVLIAGCQMYTNAIEDKEAYFRLMRQRLGAAGFPADAINAAVMRAIDTEKYTPATATIMETARQLVEERHCRLRAIARMQAEHSRRRRVAADRLAEGEREAKREMEREAHRQAEIERLRKLEAGARKRFGDDGPLPGDIQLADSISNSQVSRGGKRISWQAALAAGELWPAKFSRLMALAARLRQALEQGRVSWDRALTIAKMISADEANVRRQIDDIEGVAASYPGDQPTESFWRALCKIHTACGLDAPRFPEDAAAAAIESLKHLTGLAELADTRAILDRQVEEEWKRRFPPPTRSGAERKGAEEVNLEATDE